MTSTLATNKQCAVCSRKIDTGGYLTFGDYCGHTVCMNCLSKNTWSMCQKCNGSLFAPPTSSKPPKPDETMTYQDIYVANKALEQYYRTEQKRLENITRFAEVIVRESKDLAKDASMAAWGVFTQSDKLIKDKWIAENSDRYVGVPGKTDDILIHDNGRTCNEIIMPLTNFCKSFPVQVSNYFGRFEIKYTATTDKLALWSFPQFKNSKFERECEYEFYKEFKQLRENDKSAITEISVVEIPDPNRRIYGKMASEKDFACIAIKTEAHNLHLIYMDELALQEDGVSLPSRYIGFTFTEKSLYEINITMSDDFYMAAGLLGFEWPKIINY